MTKSKEDSLRSAIAQAEYEAYRETNRAEELKRELAEHLHNKRTDKAPISPKPMRTSTKRRD